MRDFLPSPKAIKAQAATDIAAPPEHVAAIYSDIDKWGETFIATIEYAQFLEIGDNWQRIEVAHKIEGRVPNTLIFHSDTEIGLMESKKLFDASFLNQFQSAVGGGTHYVITAYTSLKGIYKVLIPLLTGYVRWKAIKQMRNYVLDPLKIAAEKECMVGACGPKSDP